VKNSKIGVLAFGVLGIIAMFIPSHGMSLFSLLKLISKGQLVIMLLAFGLPAVMGALMVKGPAQKWQGGVAAAGFALASYKLEIWKAIAHIGDLVKAFPMLLIVLAAIGGLVASILTLTAKE
jgi:hypothetical protein